MKRKYNSLSVLEELQMERRSSEVNASSPFSIIISSSAIRWESSWLCSGGVCSPMLIVRPNERRRSSLANPAQSRSRPCLAPAFAKALLKPVCQSRMVPPVSNVRALTSSKINAKVLILHPLRCPFCFGLVLVLFALYSAVLRCTLRHKPETKNTYDHA